MKAQTQRQLRRLHNYFGLFLAPAILFFAISGGLQVFHLHEDKGWGGPPPAFLAAMGSIHKDQVLGAKPPKPHAAKGHDAAPPPPGHADDDHADAGHAGAPPYATWALKFFAAIVALGLAVSTLFGIAIALGSPATRRTSLILLAVGTALPVLLLVI